MMDIINEKHTEEEILPENTEKEDVKQENTHIKAAQMDLKTIVLWIYNINQNGTANIFQEEMSHYFAGHEDGTLKIRDMTPEMIVEFLSNLTTAKEIEMPDLGVRLILFVYNCNQNGANNTTKIAQIANS